MSINYLSLRNSNLSSFNAITINYSTLAGSTITGSTIASISTISVSTIFNSTINARLVNYSTLVGSTISTVTFRASTIGIGTAPTASPMTVFNTRTTPYTNAPTMTISDGAPITTGTYGMVHLTRPSGVLDYKGYLTFIRNGSTNVQMMGYLQNSDTFGWIVTNATSNPMNTLNGIFMDSNGNVGIGVTNPTYKLHVVGSIYADNLNMAYFNASGAQKAGGIFFTGDIPAAQWQVAIIGDYKLGFNINNTGTDGYSPSYTPVITFGNTGSITCGAINSGSITLNNTNVPLYLYNFGPTNYSAIYADAGGTMTFATGTGGVGTRMTIAPSGTVTVNNEMISTGLNANHFRAVQGSYGVILRNDGGRFYFLTTAVNDPYGSWGTTRPFSFDLSSGRLFSDNGQTFSGGLTVNGGFNVSGLVAFSGGNDKSLRFVTDPSGNYIQSANGAFTANANLYLTGHNANTTNVFVSGNLAVSGGVNINGTNSSGWALDVANVGSGSMYLGPTAYLIENGVVGGNSALGGFTMGVVGDLSVRFQGRMVAAGVTKYSDSRIKKDVIQIDNETSLQQIRLLEPVSYHFVDPIRNGTKIDYGFIAQDVKKIIPNSIIYEQNYIPNIFDNATIINKNIIQLANKNCFTIDMKKIQIICEDNTRLELSITVLSSNSCKLDSEIDYSICFVYGSYVNDMHILKNEMIYTIGISAIKELDKKILLLEDEKILLKETIKTQQSQLDKLLAWATTQGYTP